LNIVLSRRISTHRSIIATLKAFGYTNVEIGVHYLQSSLVVAGAGALAGVIGGHWMGSGLARLYSEFYRFPSFVYRSDPRVIIAAVTISLMAAIVGSIRAVRGAVRLLPAEAMQPPAPPLYRRTWLERVGFSQALPVTMRMVMRSLQRRPIGAALSSVGIAFSVAVMVMTGFFSDALEHLIQFQFAVAQRHDVQVVFREMTSARAKHDLRNLPGVFEVEPFRAVAVNLKNGHRNYRTSVLGLDSQRHLYRLLNTEATPIRLPADGIVLNDKLADILRVTPGDTVTVEVLEGEQVVRPIEVAGIAREYSGTNGYMDRYELNRFLKEDEVLSGAFLTVDNLRRPELYQQLKRTPQVASVSIKSAMIKQFRETIAANQLTMQSFTVFFATVIAVGVVYNMARISLDERSRELATLRVIGLTHGEVSAILLGELAVVTLVAIPLGWCIGLGLCFAMVLGFESELYRIPLVIHPGSYARAAIVTIVAAVASGLVVRRRLDHLDLVEVLKSRE
jgi:putative ABC transport system permease protein